ncbi:YesN/AraC family two-component response regulator [Planomicrobium soli]|uniref:YesN/AraC family two-component response regulator n=1 Tax=Planomicrobium soli TaxID=1176648 RepID=A0A2P8H3C3_9BACL|nr:response regulator [Planomicrobium soli]PSL40721.1 YesN/AraC family two-component response regulator [Planomicrobium soli]
MLQLMIVEDEVIERKSIHFILNKYFKEKIEIVGEAANGIEAVEKALETKPDIILMDINMPEMDGLTASAEVKKKIPECEIIILTAYGQFDYAKKSIEIGITDYLVKPYSNEDFCRSMERLILKVNQKKSETSDVRLLKKRTERMSLFIEREMIMELVHSREISIDKVMQLKEFLEIQDEKFKCLIYRSTLEEKFSDAVISKVIASYKAVTPHIICFSFFNEFVLFLFSDSIEQKAASSVFKDLHMRIQEELKQVDSLPTLLGESAVYQDVGKINDSYKEAKKQFQRNLSLLNQEINSKKPNLYKQENLLCEKILNTEIHEAMALLEKILLEIVSKGELEQIKRYAQQLCILIERRVIQFYDGHFKLKDVDNVLNEIEEIEGIKELAFYMEEVVIDLIMYIEEKRQDQPNRMTEKVKLYIKENYKNYDISLNQMADHIGVSSFYLSRSFKKQEGMSFKEFLTKIRMDEAIRHMEEGKKTIQDIALEAGYTDPNYFSKAFRKYTGLSPREYMQNFKR